METANGTHSGDGGKGENGGITPAAVTVVSAQKANGAHNGSGGK